MGRAFEYRKAAKMKRWGKMSTLFPKLSKAITMAAKEGGTDPEMNAKLRTAIQNAKAQNMPKDNIERAIKRADSSDQADYQEMNYEGKGPHGVLVFVECATDNTNRTVANVRSYFSKAGGSLVPNGSLEFMFDRKAVIEFEKPEGMDLEELEFSLIDAGLEELSDDGDLVTAYAPYTEYGSLMTAFEEQNIEYKKAGLERISNAPQEFTDEQIEEIEKLLDKLDEDDDVQEVYTNIA
jgi:YebC/PmpR family DNA-binding regulatory protein